MIDVQFICAPEKTEAEKAIIRQAFEAYSDGQRNASIKGAISTAAMTYKAVSAAGPVGLLVIPVGMLSSYWSKKAYRTQAYAYFEMMGWVRPRPPSRDIWTSYLRDDLFSRRSFGRGCPGEVAYAVVEILHENDPALTTEQLEQIGQNAKTTFTRLAAVLPDVPEEVAADVVLAAHGIYRQPSNGYVYEPPPENGFIYEPLEPPPDEDDLPPEDDEDKPKDAYTDWLYAAAGLAVAFLISRR